MKLTIITFVSFLNLFGGLSSGLAQGSPLRRPQVKSQSARISPNEPHIFISYVSQQITGPTEERRVFLRINNNSKWEIRFCSDAVASSLGETGPSYEVERIEGGGDAPDTGHSDSCGYFSLYSGKSALFSVPKDHLKKGLAIKIQYRYIWEFDSNGSDDLREPEHYVLFYSSDLP